ncbi:MAG: Deoxyribose-phosphate aldolase [candidate division TA06 bacterium 34_109]|uniref:Deoxyribose-phosphate aldolase n=1 Tax=candidate division TA06 bacterium 34_109 TaxID=1635277 RepID=A0A101I092_UNCT6|nr:MAG: Deoxyribose-phosphate aldolase [candidate division TA06 bacterium 34_109]
MKLLKYPEDRIILNNISKIDYSNALITNCPKEILKKTCDEVLKYGFAVVAAFPTYIEYVIKRLRDSQAHSQIAVGFPCGNHFMEVKLKEAEIALNLGVKEVDMVMNIYRFINKDYNYAKQHFMILIF